MPPQASTDITLPESYMKLMKKVGHIRRPFQAQAITVVSLCRFLADKFGAFEKSARTIENLNSLEECVLLLRTEINSF